MLFRQISRARKETTYVQIAALHLLLQSANLIPKSVLSQHVATSILFVIFVKSAELLQPVCDSSQ